MKTRTAAGAGLLLAIALPVALVLGAGKSTPSAAQRSLDDVVAGWQQLAEVDAVVVAIGDAAGATEVITAGDVVPDDRFRIGSVTKTFVAATIMRLAEAGVLDLDDPLDRWLDQPVRFADVTIRQLLGHTSGIPEYTASGDFFEQLDRAWSPEQMVASIAGQAPHFPPGSDWQYSNTNYILLGQVIEAATGQPYGTVMRDRVLSPAGLDDSIGTDVDVSVPGWFDIDFDGTKDDISADPNLPTLPWAAGQMVASAGDLSTFAGALFAGDLLRPDSLSQMTAENPFASRYGLGVVWTTPDGRTDVVGHSGAVIGYMAVLWWVPELEQSIVVLINDSAASDPADLAELVLRELMAKAGSST